jgi:hypothetical protein
LTHAGVVALLVGAIHPDELEPWEAALEGDEQEFAALLVLNIGFMHQHVHQQAVGIDQDVPLAPFHFFAAVVAAPPPFWLVFTDWLSIIAALGVGLRPCFRRVCSRNVVWRRSQVPSLRQVRK